MQLQMAVIFLFLFSSVSLLVSVHGQTVFFTYDYMTTTCSSTSSYTIYMSANQCFASGSQSVKYTCSGSTVTLTEYTSSTDCSGFGSTLPYTANKCSLLGGGASQKVCCGTAATCLNPSSTPSSQVQPVFMSNYTTKSCTGVGGSVELWTSSCKPAIIGDGTYEQISCTDNSLIINDYLDSACTQAYDNMIFPLNQCVATDYFHSLSFCCGTTCIPTASTTTTTTSQSTTVPTRSPPGTLYWSVFENTACSGTPVTDVLSTSSCVAVASPSSTVGGVVYESLFYAGSAAAGLLFYSDSSCTLPVLQLDAAFQTDSCLTFGPNSPYASYSYNMCWNSPCSGGTSGGGSSGSTEQSLLLYSDSACTNLTSSQSSSDGTSCASIVFGSQVFSELLTCDSANNAVKAEAWLGTSICSWIPGSGANLTASAPIKQSFPQNTCAPIGYAGGSALQYAKVNCKAITPPPANGANTRHVYTLTLGMAMAMAMTATALY